MARLRVEMRRRDPELHAHGERVAALALRVAAAMGLGPGRLEGLRLAALFHDVGKLAVPPRILGKPGKLSARELRIVADHVVQGEALLKACALPAGVCAAVRGHHERFDGAGYPDHLAARQIPLEARIVSVTDAYDALTADRPYREARSSQRVRCWMAGRAGTHFDPDVLDCFLSLRAA